jgi:hypothetical protein
MSEARVAGAYWCFPSIASLKDSVRNMSTEEEERGRRWRTEGRDGGDGGTEDLLVYGRVAQNAVLGSNAVSFIFHERPTAPSRFGFSVNYFIFLS